MRVLLLGATGNLGSRTIPTLLAHGHIVITFVRSEAKLRSMITSELHAKIDVFTGDATNTDDVYRALKENDCDSLVSTAMTGEPFGYHARQGTLTTTVSTAAIQFGKERGRPLRAWFVGGLGSLEYPGTGGWRIQDYMPGCMTAHHRATERILKAIEVRELEWTLLCVAMMRPRSADIGVLDAPREHGLAIAVGKPPAWQDSWVRMLPLVGVYLNLVPVVVAHRAVLEDVAELIADNLGKDDFVGTLVGFKENPMEARKDR